MRGLEVSVCFLESPNGPSSAMCRLRIFHSKFKHKVMTLALNTPGNLGCRCGNSYINFSDHIKVGIPVCYTLDAIMGCNSGVANVQVVYLYLCTLFKGQRQRT